MRPAVLILGLIVLLALGIAAGLVVGAAGLSDASTRAMLLELRALRIASAAFAGAALAVAGVLAQGLFRNPLASPDVLGTTAGAALGGQLVILFLTSIGSAVALPVWLAPEMALPVGCLIGGLATLAALMALARSTTRLGEGMVAVLLAGFVINAAILSISALVTTLTRGDWALGRALMEFSLGGLGGKGRTHLVLAAPLVVLGIIAALAWSRVLDLLLSGEDEAGALGVDVRRARRWILVWTALLTAAAVSLGGGVAFVGLVVPHALRGLVGPGHRRLVPLAAIGGAAFLVWCDVGARGLPLVAGSSMRDQAEVPLGVITGLIGAPLFLLLLIRTRREGLV